MKDCLTPDSRTNRSLKPFSVFDIETDPDNHAHFKLGGHYDGSSYRVFDSMRDLLDSLTRREYRHWRAYAHFGGRFDFVHIAAACDAAGYSWRAMMAGNTPRMIALFVYRGAHLFEMVDSYALLPASLDSLSKSLLPANLHKGKIDFRKASARTLAKYLERDCRALFAIIEKARELFRELGVETTRTLAGTSLRLFRTRFQKSAFPIAAWTRELTTPALAGGRNEVFARRMDSGFAADVNSMYPAMMLQNDPPAHRPRRVGRNSIIKSHGVYRVEAHINPCNIPPLPLAADRLYFPIGKFETTVWGPEALAAIESGHDVRVLAGIEWEPEPGCFAEFITRLYKLKREGGALAIVAKLAMNSLYGKFAERGNVWTVAKRPRRLGDVIINDYLPIVSTQAHRESAHMLHHFGGWITSCARADLYKRMLTVKGLAYCDTDSIWSASKVKTGDLLGEMHQEAIESARFYGPKNYCYNDAEGVHIARVKGMPGADPCIGRGGRISGLCAIKGYARRGVLFHQNIPKTYRALDKKRLEGYGPNVFTRAPVAGRDCPDKPQSAI